MDTEHNDSNLECDFRTFVWAMRQGHRSLCIGSLPGRRSIALYEETRGRIRVYAYFRSESAAHEAMTLIEHLLYE